MGEKARTLKEIKKQYEGSPDEYDRFAKKVTEAYVNDRQNLSQEDVAKLFKITSGSVRKLMDHAIIRAVVSRKTAEQVMQKSIGNQKRHHGEAGGTSIIHNSELMDQRDQYLAESCDPMLVEFIVGNITYSGFSLEDTAQSFNIETLRVLKLILQRAVIENIATDKDTDILVKQSLEANNKPYVKKYFDNLLKKREEYRAAMEEN